MPFNSISYLGFLTAVVTLFWVAPIRWRRHLVFVASLGFYAAWNPIFVFLPFVVAAVVFFFGRLLLVNPSRQTRWLWSGVAAIVGILILFKTESLIGAVVPVGISFYSFEAISCLFDLRQRRLAEPRYWDIVLYLLFWPTVVSGPILRGRELFSQLTFDQPLDARMIVSGIDRLIWGLAQKNAFANTLGNWVSVAFSNHHGAYSTVDAWTAAVAYGLQIYFDFAAYSNIAIGSAQLIGIRLPENFRFPYHAASPAEFWARWHMSLSRWIRDYLFFPINARFRGAPGPLYFSLIVVMALVGLWHGAGWGFLLWGLVHGCCLVLYRMYEDAAASRPGLGERRAVRLLWRLGTLAAVMIGWVPFRAAGLEQTAALWRSMLLRFDASMSFPAPLYTATIAAAAFCAIEPMLIAWVSWADERAAEGPGSAVVSRLALRPLLYLAGLLVFLAFGSQPGQFIYFQF